MFEQQEAQAVRVIQIPPPATPPPTSATPQAPAIAGGGPDLSGFSANQLRRMLEELRQQRSDIAGRRSSIASTYEGATGANREGIGNRLLTIDNNIVQLEQEILRVGRELAIKGPGSTPPPDVSRNIPSNYMSEDDAAGMAFGVFLATAILSVYFTRVFMRRKHGPMRGPAQPQQLQSNERLERIEQAVDTIALEMERVSENQRFMTRLMTETQLGDTLKDVRKSTELAKSAAAESG